MFGVLTYVPRTTNTVFVFALIGTGICLSIPNRLTPGAQKQSL